VRDDLPSGTVTFLFTDVEGSTRLLHSLGAEGYAEALAEHRRLIRKACRAEGGVEVDTQGDAFFFAFPTAPGALGAASTFTEALASGLIRVRVGLHTGTPLLTDEGYVGDDVHFAARVAASAHGGQVILSQSTAELVALELTDLGEHRLKDISEAVPIFQLGGGSFPPLKTISNTNLPRPAGSFVGREHELEEALALLRDGARLLTLTGPGGSGKTRLAIEAASELVPEYKAGVFWVGLATLRDPALVSETVAQALGAKDGLAEHIQERELLLLLDNFEQVVDAATTLPSLLSTCPNLRLLVTSRELLRVQGEVEYPVPPLAEAEAIELFCTRSRLESDDTIAELCRRLDSLPLALELAAARTSVLSPAQILERLSQRLDLLKGGRDADVRQQTLRATIEWSYDLLTEEEQRLFARIAVFRGGCTLEAAQEICDADLDILQALVDKSLVRHTDERFWMLETIREYAAERLDESGGGKLVRDRHLEHFLALAERAHDELTRASEWFPVLDAEHDNIRAALDWAAATRVDAEGQLMSAVATYWQLLGHTREVHERLAGALSRYRRRDRTRASLLTSLAEVDGIEQAEALSYVEEALGLWRELHDATGEAEALETLGWLHDAFGNYDAARLAHEQSLDVRRESGVPEIDGWGAMAGLCHLFVSSGEVASAEAMALDLQELGARHGARRAEQLALHFLADCPLVAGDYVESERRYLRALEHARASGLPKRCVDELLGVAMSLSGQGDVARATRLAASAHAKGEEMGQSHDHWWSTMQEWFIGGARAQLAPAELEAAERAGRAADFEAVLDEVLETEPAPDA
jgi:predicted ATPase